MYLSECEGSSGVIDGSENHDSKRVPADPTSVIRQR